MSFEQIFEAGVKSFQGKDFAKATDYFSQALTLRPDDPSVLTNLALSHYELDQKIPAYVYFKKALHVAPDNLQAQQGFEFLQSQVQVRDIPHQIEFYEKARSLLVTPISGHVPFALSWVLFIAVGYRGIRYLSRRRQAYLSGEDKPSFGLLNFALAFFFIASLSWSLFHSYDRSLQRGLVKDDTVVIRSAPSMGGPALLELNGGLEVRILRKQDGWIQVQYPGSYSGWLQKDSIVEL